ncbi:hypothetical protein [Kineococcus rhizosphaerae]|uniref:hypothetical protein n=1 Tax=Kineococcus rhizosphaerae TaxID=559628 RepID=UPI0011B1F9CF|nr:hypothetical protein [Kineococcus rhizosphaerae]
MRRWDPTQEQGTRQQRRITAAGPPAPSTADVEGFEDYPCFYAKVRHGQLLDTAATFEELVRSARGGWATGTTVIATHLAPDRHPVLHTPTWTVAGPGTGSGSGRGTGAGVAGSPEGAVCTATRWVADRPGSATGELVAALRVLHALDALPQLSIQREVIIGSPVVVTQAAWLRGETGAGVDGFRVQCGRRSGHEGSCVVRALVGDLTWGWDRVREVIDS